MKRSRTVGLTTMLGLLPLLAACEPEPAAPPAQQADWQYASRQDCQADWNTDDDWDDCRQRGGGWIATRSRHHARPLPRMVSPVRAPARPLTSSGGFTIRKSSNGG